MTRRTWAVLLVVTTIASSSCKSQDQYLPLELGRTWTYQVRGKFSRFVEPVTVSRRMSVAGGVGYEVSGPLGRSRLAWKGNRLVADRLNDSRFEPPLPLLIPGYDGTEKWHGRMSFMGKVSPAATTLVQKAEEVKIGTRKYTTVAATLTLRCDGRRIELTSWYSPGIGIIRQTQWTNGLEDFSIELLSG